MAIMACQCGTLSSRMREFAMNKRKFKNWILLQIGIVLIFLLSGVHLAIEPTLINSWEGSEGNNIGRSESLQLVNLDLHQGERVAIESQTAKISSQALNLLSTAVKERNDNLLQSQKYLDCCFFHFVHKAVLIASEDSVYQVTERNQLEGNRWISRQVMLKYSNLEFVQIRTSTTDPILLPHDRRHLSQIKMSYYLSDSFKEREITDLGSIIKTSKFESVMKLMMANTHFGHLTRLAKLSKLNPSILSDKVPFLNKRLFPWQNIGVIDRRLNNTDRGIERKTHCLVDCKTNSINRIVYTFIWLVILLMTSALVLCCHIFRITKKNWLRQILIALNDTTVFVRRLDYRIAKLSRPLFRTYWAFCRNTIAYGRLNAVIAVKRLFMKLKILGNLPIS